MTRRSMTSERPRADRADEKRIAACVPIAGPNPRGRPGAQAHRGGATVGAGNGEPVSVGPPSSPHSDLCAAAGRGGSGCYGTQPPGCGTRGSGVSSFVAVRPVPPRCDAVNPARPEGSNGSSIRECRSVAGLGCRPFLSTVALLRSPPIGRGFWPSSITLRRSWGSRSPWCRRPWLDCSLGLATAVSNAGGLGRSRPLRELDAIREEIRKMGSSRISPLRSTSPRLLSAIRISSNLWSIRYSFVTTSAAAARYTAEHKGAGQRSSTWFAWTRPEGHRGRRRRLGGGGRGGRGLRIRRTFPPWCFSPGAVPRGLPIIAAGGFTDGVTMAAALALGAEAVQMGTRRCLRRNRQCQN